MIISAQVSIYPLGTDDLSPAINLALETLRKYDVEFQIGSMSTTIMGEMETVQNAINAMFKSIAFQYAVIMQCTMSNSCPLTTKKENDR